MMWEQHGEGEAMEPRTRRTIDAAEEANGSRAATIPCQEMNSLLLVVGDAFTAGDCGEQARGYLLLRLGMERALRLAAEGQPWAAALCTQWRRFLAEYELRYPEVRPAVAPSH